jgi:hypothetical protein
VGVRIQVFGPRDVAEIALVNGLQDGVWDDGDFYKGGVFGQGLYVSPGRELVVWYATAMFSNLTQYARQIALDTPPAR